MFSQSLFWACLPTKRVIFKFNDSIYSEKYIKFGNIKEIRFYCEISKKKKYIEKCLLQHWNTFILNNNIWPKIGQDEQLKIIIFFE